MASFLMLHNFSVLQFGIYKILTVKLQLPTHIENIFVLISFLKNQELCRRKDNWRLQIWKKTSKIYLINKNSGIVFE